MRASSMLTATIEGPPEELQGANLEGLKESTHWKKPAVCLYAQRLPPTEEYLHET